MSYTIVAAPEALYCQLQAVLRDWASLQVIDDVVLLNLDAGLLRREHIAALKLAGGEARPISLLEDLASAQHEYISLCVVGGLADATYLPKADTVSSVQGVLTSRTPNAKRVFCALTVGSPGDDWASHTTVREGWHNLVVSPEEALSPLHGSAPITHTNEDGRWLMHVCGTISSLLGLWRGQSQSPLADRTPTGGASVMPVRAFARSLTADQVTAGVWSTLADFSSGYPAPQVGTTTASRAPDEAAVADGMAEAVYSNNLPELQLRERVRPKQVGRRTEDWLTTIKQFFVFLLDALRNAPRALAQGLYNGVRQRLAETVQNVVYGQDSSVEVAVSGVKADGSTASLQDFDEGITRLLRRRYKNYAIKQPETHPKFLRHVVDGALTLLDAGNRSEVVKPVMSGADRVVVGSAHAVAPTGSDAVFTLHPALAAYLPGWSIQAGDSIAVDRLTTQLEQLKVRTPRLAAEISAEEKRLSEWQKGTRRTYIGQIGHRLANLYTAANDEVLSLTKRLEQLRKVEEMPLDVAASQDSLSKKMKIFTLLLVGVIAVLATLFFTSIIGALWLAIGSVVSILVWFVVAVQTYIANQRQLYQSLFRADQAVAELAAGEQNLQAALEDLRRIGLLYRQYLEWAQAVGSFVHAPVGAPSAASVNALRIGESLPMNVRIGAAQPDAAQLNDALSMWRPQLFQAGWLTDRWEGFASALPETSPAAVKDALSAGIDVLFRDTVVENRPLLNQWRELVCAHAASRPIAEDFARQVSHLMQEDLKARDMLLAQVSIRDADNGRNLIITREEFSGGLEQDSGAVPMQFADTVFDSRSAHTGGQAVDTQSTQRCNAFDGLAHSVVVVEFGHPLPVDSLVGTGQPQPEPTAQSAPSAVDNSFFDVD